MHLKFGTTILLTLIVTTSMSAAQAGARAAGELTIVPTIDNVVDEEKRLYIVQMNQPPALAALNNEQRSNPAAGQRFNPNDGRVLEHVYKLEAQQDRALASVNALDDRIYRYSYTFNGMAVLLTPSAAQKLQRHRNVARIWEDERRPVSTNSSPQFLGLLDIDGGLQADLGLRGEDIVIGVIDSGITPNHPSFSDTRKGKQPPKLCRGTWGETSLLGRFLCRKYRRRAKPVPAYDEPTDWRGTCQTGEGFGKDACNNKVIGARFYRAGIDATTTVDQNEFNSPADADGHGTHIATIAAGNKTEAVITDRDAGEIRGMAPRARVAVYKACWILPGTTRASCSNADLQKAIEDAVADGVDIINYSIGGADQSVTDPDDLALLAAAEAGILSAVAAGNDGPEEGTINSPGTTPWVISVGSSTRPGSRLAAALRVNLPASIAGDYENREASFTSTLKNVGPITAPLILGDDNSQAVDTSIFPADSGNIYDGCSGLVNSATIANNIALIQRGGCNFDVKVSNAQAAGATAVVVFSNDNPLVTMASDGMDIDIPAVLIGQADGQLIRDRLLADEAVEITLDKDIIINLQEVGDMLTTQSSRGPDIDFLKPDVVAPGENILGGHTPEVINGFRGENFQYLTGTSQAAPHVAGVAALLKEARPEWSAAELKSALMTSARQNIVLDSALTPADPFDIGAGHIVPNSALDPGLLYDTDINDYDAYLCSLYTPRITAAECEQLFSDGYGRMASDINLPSVLVDELVAFREVKRKVKNPGPAAQFDAEWQIPAGVALTVTPETLSLGTGETGEFTLRFTNNGASPTDWLFGSLTWKNATHSVYSPLSVRTSAFNFVAPPEIRGLGADGTLPVPLEFGYDGTYQALTSGLYLPCVLPDDDDVDDTCGNTSAADISNDSFDYNFVDNPGTTIERFVITVPPEDDLWLRIALFDELTDGNDDLDLYVYYCVDSEPEPEPPTICEDTYPVGTGSGDSPGISVNDQTSDEQIDVFEPEPGAYIIDVHGYNTDETIGGPGAKFRAYAWSFGNNNDAGNLSIAGAPVDAVQGTVGELSAIWQSLPEGLWLGGISHLDGGGSLETTIIQVDNDAFTQP